MRNRKLLLSILAFISICFISFLYNNFFTKAMLMGKFTLRNHEYSGIEQCSDTLILFENNKFVSTICTNGNGFYKISYSSSGTSIELRGEFEFENLSTYITREWFGSPKIILDTDLGKYYEKID